MTTVNRQHLVAALRAVRVAAGGTKSLPVLENVAIESVGDQLQLTTTNLDTYVRRHVAFTGDPLPNTTVNAKSLHDFVSGFSAADVKLVLDDKKLRLTSGKNRASINTIPFDDFPAWPSLSDNAVSFTLTRDQFEAVGKRVASFASSDTGRPILMGVHVRGNGTSIQFQAADNYRIGVLTIEHQATLDAVLPAAIFGAVVKAVEGDDIQIAVASNGAMFASDQGMITSRVIDGMFPNTEAVLPKEFKSRLLVDPDDLLDAGKLAALASAADIVKFELVDEGLHAFSKDYDREFDTTMDATVSADGEKKVNFALNARFVSAIAAAFPSSPGVEIGWGGALAPVAFRDPNDPTFLAVVMPVRTPDA